MNFDALRILSLLAFDSVAIFTMPADVLAYPILSAAEEFSAREKKDTRVEESTANEMPKLIPMGGMS